MSAPPPGAVVSRTAMGWLVRCLAWLTLSGEALPWGPILLAIPFAYAAAVLGWGGIPPWTILVWMALAATGARIAATAIHQVVDGGQGVWRAFVVAIAGSLLLLVAAGRLNVVAFWLSPLSVLAYVIYPYTRRWTWACHLFLGLACAMGPGGGWVASRAAVEGPAWLLAGAVGLWIAGFDVVRVLTEPDPEHDACSIPARFGYPFSWRVARLVHLGAVLLWIAAGWATGRAWWYFGGVAAAAALLAWQHAVAARDHADAPRARRALDVAGLGVSLVMLAASVVDVVVFP